MRCGFSISRPSAAGTAFISRTLFVRPAFRKRGIGKALMARLAQALRRRGLCAFRMGGARLERAVDRVLQVDRRAGAWTSGKSAALSGEALAGLRAARGRTDADRAGRRRRRKQRHRPRRQVAVAAQVRSAAFPRADAGQAGDHGPQDLSVDRQAARPAAPTSWSRRDPTLPRRASMVAPSLHAALALARADAQKRGATRSW